MESNRSAYRPRKSGPVITPLPSQSPHLQNRAKALKQLCHAPTPRHRAASVSVGLLRPPVSDSPEHVPCAPGDCLGH